ncbi:MAG: hypothetical protein SXA11_06815 [Cyanobacteriota bacterium]|nr:hypothetical protein [Cyanobacteriota bacterium]
MKLPELKEKAAKSGLTPDDVRVYGQLTRKNTWEKAIAANTPTSIPVTFDEPAADEPAADEPIFQVGDRVRDVRDIELNRYSPGTVTKLLSSGKVSITRDCNCNGSSVAQKPKYLQKIITGPMNLPNPAEIEAQSQNESDLFALVPLFAPVPSGVATETASFIPPAPVSPTIPLPEPEEEPEEETPVSTIVPGCKVRRNERQFRHTAKLPDEIGVVTQIDTQNHRALVKWPRSSRWTKMASLNPILQPKNALALIERDDAAVARFKDKSLSWLKKYVRDRGASDTFVTHFGEYVLGRQYQLYPINSRQAWFEVCLWLESSERDSYQWFCGFWLHPDERTFISKIGLDSDFWKEIKTLTFYRGIYANNYLDFYYEVCRYGSIERAARYFGYPLSRFKDKYIPGRCSDKSSEPAASLFFQVHRYLFNEWAKRSESALSDRTPGAIMNAS